ncbi:MAG TPA: hypothetical protein VMV90_12175 [Rectinemataceae bacterium]|nr:hypothetical protein [Rectinemataceae bacterium]
MTRIAGSFPSRFGASAPGGPGRRLPLAARVCLLALAAFSAPQLWAGGAARGFLLGVLDANGAALRSSEARLASGRELLTDDPANEAIYQALEAQVRGMGLELGNNADMRSYYRFQDAILAQVIGGMRRIRDLAVRRGDPTLGSDGLAIVDDEIDQYYQDILSTLGQADFNGLRPFAALASRPDIARWFSQKRYYRLDSIDRLMSAMIDERSRLGAADKGLAFASEGEAIGRENTTAEQSLSDTDVASESSALKREDLLFLADLFLLK